MDLQRSIESNNSLYPAKLFWPDWPENVQCQLSGQIVLARLARQWPDFAGYSLPIADLIAIFNKATPELLINGNSSDCRLADFYTTAIQNIRVRKSNRSSAQSLIHSIGHSIRHFVLYGYSVLKMYFYRTLSQLKSAKSYLMVKLKNLASHIISNCISAICLFDGYLIEVDYKGYKTPKPLDKSGFFPPLPLGQRDMSKVAILNI